VLELTPLISKIKPDILISFPSPDAFRTAFGLGIKSIQINDSPHSYAPGRLTISLSDALVHSSSINSKEFSKLGTTKYFPYNGVDEILWIKNYKPDFALIENLGLENNEYLVMRCEESKAGYFQRLYPDFVPGDTIITQLVDELTELYPNIKIVAFPRYPEQEKQLVQKDVIIPETSIDTLSLFYYSRAVMTAGGTMGREAALLGTPTMYTFPHELLVSKHVSDLGFPLLHCPNHEKILDEMIKLINSTKMDNIVRETLINELETPYDGVLRAMADLGV
jgi:predicted glycosyltransferase